jgi:AbrB family looped-hinge helix DNA binding protein
MKSTGMVRRIDNLGRVVIPKEIRKVLGIKEGDQLDITIDDGVIHITKFSVFGQLHEFVINILMSTKGKTNNDFCLIENHRAIASTNREYILYSFNDEIIKNIKKNKPFKAIIKGSQWQFIPFEKGFRAVAFFTDGVETLNTSEPRYKESLFAVDLVLDLLKE